MRLGAGGKAGARVGRPPQIGGARAPRANAVARRAPPACRRLAKAPVRPPCAATAGGGGGGGGGGASGGGGGDSNDEGGGDGDDRGNAGTAAAAAAAAKSTDFDQFCTSLKSHPPAFVRGLFQDLVKCGAPPEIFANLRTLLNTGVFGAFLNIPGFRERLLIDAAFFTKVGVECGIGVVTKLSAEKAKRGDNFSRETEYVVANVIMAVIADFLLVWLPAPAFYPDRRGGAGAAASASKNALAAFWDRVPNNAFEKVVKSKAQAVSGTATLSSPTMGMGLRACAILKNGSKLFAVGCASSFIGVAITNFFAARKAEADNKAAAAAASSSKRKKGEAKADAGKEKAPAQQDLLKSSILYGVYMATSSNLRYQFLAGVVEQRMLKAMFKSEGLQSSISSVLRVGNTFLGSMLWVDFVRLTGLQPAKPKEELDYIKRT